MEMVTLNSARNHEAYEDSKPELKQLNLDLAVKTEETEPLLERNNPEERISPKAQLKTSDSLHTQIFQSPQKGRNSSQGIYDI